jgi:hypothetical protein
MLAALLATGCFVCAPHAPRLPVFERGPALDVFSQTSEMNHDMTLANFWAHTLSSSLIVVAGERIGGRRGMWWTVAGYSALTVLHVSTFQDPHLAGPEVRSDLLSRLGSALLTAGLYEGLHAAGVLDWK